MIIRRPFEVFELGDKLRLHPAALFHLFFRKALAPSAALRFRKIHKGANFRSEFPKAFHKGRAGRWHEAIAGPGHIHEVLSFVIPEDDGIEGGATDGVPADDKFLPAVNPHLLPGARASTEWIKSGNVACNVAE
jgi:hypothetical protein